MSDFSAVLHYRSTGRWNRKGRPLYETEEPFTYLIGGGGSTLTVTVEAGFVTDLASVPRPLYWFLPPDGPWAQAAVLHDWLYSGTYVPRWMADGVLYDAAGAWLPGWPRVGRLQRLALWLGVRIGGGRAYRRYERNKEEAR